MSKIDEQEFIQICKEAVNSGKIDPESYWKSVYFRVCSKLQVDSSRMPIQGQEDANPEMPYVLNLSMKMQNHREGSFDALAIGSKILNDART
jgi:hypothetical protein